MHLDAHGSPGGPRPDGFALIAVILAIGAISLLLAGLVFLGAEELWIAVGAEELLRARLAAESAVRSEMVDWRSSELGDLPVGSVRQLPDRKAEGTVEVTTYTMVERLDAGVYLIRAESVVPSGASATAAALLRAIDPVELMRGLPATISTNGHVDHRGGEAVTGYSPHPDDGSGYPCRAAAPAFQLQAFGTAARPPISNLDAGYDEGRGLGPLGLEVLRELADRIEEGEIDFRSVGGGGCGGGGEGEGSIHERCERASPLIYAPEGLRVVGGQGAGILVVAGELEMHGSAEFHGIIIAGGPFRLAGSARLHGAALVAGQRASVMIGDEARAEYDPCAIEQAIAGAGLTDRVYRQGERSWIPGF